MKKITLLMATVILSAMSFAQVVVRLTDVPCNTGLEGTYPYGESGWTAQPDLLIGANAVSGALEMINDGTPGTAQAYLLAGGAPYPSPPLQAGVPASACGCDTTNFATQDLTGKIAVIYRGRCEFGYKAYNAQIRGAVGVIIINHTGDPIPMGAGSLGGSVTIPVVMVGRIAGDDLFLAMQSCTPGSVMGFIGSKVGLFNNDMGSSMSDILMPNELAKPWDLAQTGAEFPVELGFRSFNYGTNAQNGVTATVDIQFAGSSVYNNTSAPVNFAAPGATIDTQYFDLGIYAPATLGVGTYTVTYTLSIVGTDEEPTDNVYTFDYKLTNNADVYAKSRTDANSVPIHSTAYSLNETTTLYNDWEPCIVFRDANVASRNGSALGMHFTGAPVGINIDYEVVEIRAYQWNDAFTGLNLSVASPYGVTFNSLVPVADASYYWDYSADGDLSNQMVYVPFTSPLPLLSNQRYLFCIYNASDSVRIGFDGKIDYNTTIENYLQPIAPVKTLTSALVKDWDPIGFGTDATPAISVTMEFPNTVGINTESNTVYSPYPNPAANLLTVPVRKGVVGNVSVEIYDLAGKLVISENQTIGNEPLKVNVASIANGAYVFNLTFADGSKDTFKVSVNR